jgi:hypothetical protein
LADHQQPTEASAPPVVTETDPESERTATRLYFDKTAVGAELRAVK